MAAPAWEHSGITTTRLIRLGNWHLVTPGDFKRDKSKDLVERIVRGLDSDARVTSVTPPNIDDYWTTSEIRYPYSVNIQSDDVLDGSDHYHVLRMSEPIVFDVRVPIKNQPTHHGADDIPTDRYSVVWDGIVAIVCWDQSSPTIPLSGGHIASSVLSDVLQKSGCRLQVQNCSAGCDFGFLHTAVRVRIDEDLEDDRIQSRSDGAPEFVTNMSGPPSVSAEFAYWTLATTLAGFSEFKSTGRRILSIETRCRNDLSALLIKQQAHSSLVSARFSPRRLRRQFMARAWRKEARSLISSVWLCVASMETLRRDWEEQRFHVESESSFQLLIAKDARDDVSQVIGLRTEGITDAAEQVAAALDNRLVVAATAWGALAGGVAGGVVGLLAR